MNGVGRGLKVKGRSLIAGPFIDGAVVAAFKNGPELAEQRVGRLLDQDHVPLTDLGHVHIIDGSSQLLKLGEELFVFKRELDPLVNIDDRTDAHFHSQPVFVPLFHGRADLRFSGLHKSVQEYLVESFVF